MSAPLPAPALIDSIYREHHGWLLGWFLRRLSGSSQAADLAHDTFVRLITSRELAQVREPRAFLRTLAHGVIVNHWRRADVERAWAEAVAAQPELLAPSPEERMIAVEMLCRIDAMLNTLSDKARKAFLLSQIDGRTYAEIALELGVSDRMVKKYMAQAMLQCLLLAQEP
ncbi:RNA polymerase subunit sigma [Variovorax paradoxus]|jgi:RNA polymerase sigma-70 factor (ECF subfamily)|uniref:sigma-70 family RNA polymerase sigma factor n=1 Tax=Variovorax TaxID=34072 RepID=UPI0006E73128|nr:MULTISPECIES: sigma-70 family RNA polymerase sigma factor [unclassified Variovorax]KPU88459.1 RNA polymerase subunit sigma [Variovorax paradoxus]KPU93136.1 RNA polymerase subunit sigma [Variovorax paradoxus]KPU94759.1 RNA polymerase subunit sigma [Variovorax paradoxus]KPV14781.1 RNA polymerase subunit sigma [Variovorax paradoxus]KPV21610.1 RNA polymerase subunit sigma [Variovorax paradoxus]